MYTIIFSYGLFYNHFARAHEIKEAQKGARLDSARVKPMSTRDNGDGDKPFYGSFRRKKSLIPPRNFLARHFRIIPCKTGNKEVKKSPRTQFSGINKKVELFKKEAIK